MRHLLAVLPAIVAACTTAAAPPRPLPPSQDATSASEPARHAAHLGRLLAGGGTDQTGELALPTVLPRRPAAAPYLVRLRTAGGDALERLPLESTGARVRILGPMAQVTLTQVFRNRGQEPIEARYVFPASTQAAVHGVRLNIGARTIRASVAPRGEARRTYEAARDGGRHAALLEEERPNVFSMSIANVAGGERITAEVDYTEVLAPERGTYELVWPTVVGPRYVSGRGPGDEDQSAFTAGAHLPPGEAAPFAIAFTAQVEAPSDLAEITSPSHALDVRRTGPRAAEVSLAPGARGGGDRDLVLRWRLAQGGVGSGLYAAPDPGGGGHFLLVAQPPSTLPPERVAPREVIFVLDVSGSMDGFPLDTGRALVAAALGGLRPTDRFNLVLFDNEPRVLEPRRGSLPASPANVARAQAALAAAGGGGGTELLAALREAYALPRVVDGLARSVVLVTDGLVPFEAATYRLVAGHSGEVSTWAFGVGTSVNRALVEAVARAGAGEAFVATSPVEAGEAANRLAEQLAGPMVTGVEVRLEGSAVDDVLPGRVRPGASGAAPAAATVERLPDLHAGRPLVVSGWYEGAPPRRAVISGETPSGRWEQAVEVTVEPALDGRSAAGLLWARRWARRLEDEAVLAPSEALDAAIGKLGETFGLLTPFTSFVATDSEVVTKGGRPPEVRQVLPTPAGLSERAYPGSGPVVYAYAPLRAPLDFVDPAAALALRAPPARPAPRGAPPPPITCARADVEVEVLDRHHMSAADEAAFVGPLRDLLAQVALPTGEVVVAVTLSGDCLIVDRQFRAGDSVLMRKIDSAIHAIEPIQPRCSAGATLVIRVRVRR